MRGATRAGRVSLVQDGLDEKVVAALGDVSMRVGALDGKCASLGVPAYVGDYLLAEYGDDDDGSRRAVDVLDASAPIRAGLPPAGRDVVCRVYGARRMDDDVYGISTACPLLHMLGVGGEDVRAARLLDGSWCHLSVRKRPLCEGPACEIFDVTSSDGDLRRFDMVNYEIEGLNVVRGGAGLAQRLLRLRLRLSTDEWTRLLMRSYGLGGENLDMWGRIRLLWFLAPLAQPGLRVLLVGDADCAGALEASPYEVPAGQLQLDFESFPGSWDCVVAEGEVDRGMLGLSLLLDSYEGIASGLSLAAVSGGDDVRLRRLKRLFGPFHIEVPTPRVMRASADQSEGHLGVNRCVLCELWHALRDKDLPADVEALLDHATGIRGEGREAARLAFAGIYKVLSPDGAMPAGEAEELLEFVLRACLVTGA
ncbi:MAG: hypothetical protein IKG22_01130 [Atopobiaceae bacterium]|nr:hypothetical protein [Atopobiaceae bacterium]